MHLPRHTIESHAPVPLFQHASFSSADPNILHSLGTTQLPQNGAHQVSSTNGLAQPSILSCASLNGFLVAHTDPLKLVANRSWSPSQGGLSHAVPVQHTSLLFLVGGGRVPRFAPNKVILWDEAAEYTAKTPAGASRDADSDDDDTGSLPSRRASTIFSAGGEFDAYGKAQLDDLPNSPHDERPIASSSRSFSPVNSVRFSTSSLIDADQVEAHLPRSPVVRDPPSEGRDGNELALSMDASSIGIGRLQASNLSEPSDHIQAADSISHRSYRPDLASSIHSHSISASSANLADPFAQDGIQAAQADRSPSHKRVPASKASSSATPSPASFDSPDSSFSQASTSHQRLFPSRSSQPPGAGLVDSVSSMATTATAATAQAQPQILHGREVAELEFSEIVRGIYATSVQSDTLNVANDDFKERGRASADTPVVKRLKLSSTSVVLVVLLASKAIVFELLPSSSQTKPQGRQTSSSWKIHKRAVVQTYKNPNGLGSVAPYYAPAMSSSKPQASAIVAVPGRQKGHVQLLRVTLQSQASHDPSLALSNPSASAGAASIIVAHESSIAAIALSPNGQTLATASSKGTLIRIWTNTITVDSGRQSTVASKPATAGRTGFGANLARELRRGSDPATILSIAFAPDASLVAAASDKGTIHIFLLSEATVPSTTAARSDQSPSSPSSSSRAANLGRAAAQYLPAGIGSLAGQIPPSVLPQYLKSEWSIAQYRIPLKSFGASRRHYSTTSSADDGAYSGAGAAPSSRKGTEKSTEGAWAQMRGRISDIRKGEASVDEKIFLCWIIEAKDSSGPSPPTVKRGTRSDVQASRVEKSRPQAKSQAAEERHALDENDPRERYRLVAVTTSGGWYKLAVTVPRPSDKGNVSGSTVLDMYRRNAWANARRTDSLKEKTMQCRLLEYRPMTALMDGWRA